MAKFSNPPNQSKGILDDYAVRKNVATREGTVEKVPVNPSDIANKAYVDANIGGGLVDKTYILIGGHVLQNGGVSLTLGL